MTAEPLDYDALVTEYQSGLVDKLRSFGPAADFLELWVPDADLAESLAAMVDAAAAAGTANFPLFLGPKTAAALDLDALTEAVKNQALISSHDENGGKILEFSAIHDARPVIRNRQPEKTPQKKAPPDAAIVQPAAAKAGDGVPDAPGAYTAALTQRDLSHTGEWEKENGLVMVEAKADDAVLSLAVDPTAHLIRQARHRDAATPEQAALVDCFCALIEELPIQEAADHGVIRLETRLRDHASGGRPVPGVVSPQAAWPGFALPQALIRRALANYRDKTGYTATENDYDTEAGAEWLGLDDAARRQRISAAIESAAGEPSVTAIEYDVRVVVRFRGDIAGGDKQRQMMKMEQAIKTSVDPRLELYQEELKDGNVIRRLAGAED